MSMKVEANPSASGAGVTSVNGDSGPAVTLTTANINEGGSNLYYTDARFDTRLAAKTTDNLTEGSNLYFTNTRADNRIAAADLNDLSNVSAAAPNNNEVLKYNSTSGNWESSADSSGVTSVNGDSGPAVTLTTANIAEGGSNLYYTDARFDTRLAAKTTDNLTEGSNLYFTNTRADGRISAANLTDLNDVNYTAGAGIDGKFLKYVDSNNRWEAADGASGVTSVNGDSGPAVTLTTANIAEGGSNLYYTDARFDTRLAAKTTDNLTEGSNLYYTDTRFDTRLAAKTTDNLTEGSNLYFTNTRADGRISAANLTDLNDVNYTAGVGINNYVLTYVDSNNRWEAKEAAAGGGSYTGNYESINNSSSPVTAEIDHHYGADSSGGAITFNLPALSGLTGGEELRVKLNTAGNDLTITANGSDTIEGSGQTYVLNIAKSAVTCVASSGTNWEII